MRTSLKNQSGVMIADFVLAMSLAILLLSVVSQKVSVGQRNIKDQAVAQQLKIFSDAAEQYVKANHASLYSTAAGGPFSIAAASIQSAGFLPAGFSPINGYMQTACLLVRRSPSALNVLEPLIVTEGGSTINADRVPAIAALAGARGGAVESVAGTLTVRGAVGGYAFPLANYAGAKCTATSTSAGRLASALLFDNQQVVVDYVYRYPVPGHPEANQMFTTLNMGGNNVTNVATVDADCLRDRTDPSFLVCPAGSSNVNSLVANSLTAPKLIDKDNPAYFVDPNATSRLSDAYIDARSTTVKLSSLLPNFVDKGATFLFNNQLVAKPSCPDSGTPEIRLSAAVWQTDTSNLANVFATNAGAAWQLRMTSTGGVSMPPGAGALAVVGCSYL